MTCRNSARFSSLIYIIIVPAITKNSMACRHYPATSNIRTKHKYGWLKSTIVLFSTLGNAVSVPRSSIAYWKRITRSSLNVPVRVCLRNFHSRSGKLRTAKYRNQGNSIRTKLCISDRPLPTADFSEIIRWYWGGTRKLFSLQIQMKL